jgi:hypothetical protein
MFLATPPLNQVKEIWQFLLKLFNYVYQKSQIVNFWKKEKIKFAKMRNFGY